VTVVVHLAGLDGLLSLTRLHLSRFKTAWLGVDRMIVPLGIVLGLFLLHGAEIWIYALVYRGLGVMPDLEQALFVSISTYSTLGEAGALLGPSWRIMGGLEAVNGLLLLGWSTAFLFQVLRHLLATEDDQRLPRGAIARDHHH
jgi:hypothetical protein